MAARVGIRELRQNASKLLKRVAGGETVEITDRGRPIARIVPLRPGTLDQLVLEGRAVGADRDLLEVAENLGLPAASARLPSVALAELRADEQ